ncbi:hypothetical protein PHYPSEUDO_011174 [Phytophthora pseudosyringae]|uniref:Uncharacterized protein n=1 Tax=Phytophthora pseudosyringae TaxID=221518 RepID=A0A8T1V8N0_9STRA|nr:hypothetical protein PHYPSEUDO_011174 [Phytophthora pseudosyringae]
MSMRRRLPPCPLDPLAGRVRGWAQAATQAYFNTLTITNESQESGSATKKIWILVSSTGLDSSSSEGNNDDEQRNDEKEENAAAVEERFSQGIDVNLPDYSVDFAALSLQTNDN